MIIFQRIRRKIFLTRPENLTLHFVEDNLLLMVALEDDEEVKLEPEEKINKRVKLNL